VHQAVIPADVALDGHQVRARAGDGQRRGNVEVAVQGSGARPGLLRQWHHPPYGPCILRNLNGNSPRYVC